MGMFDTYKYEKTPKVAKGIYWAWISDIGTTPSKKGDPMITVTIQLNKHPQIRIKEFLTTASVYFNRDVSRVCDCFGVEPEDDKLMTWPGAVGLVSLREDGDYMRVARYIPRDEVEKTEGAGAWEGPMPERQTVTSIPRSDAASPEDDSDELPF